MWLVAVRKTIILLGRNLSFVFAPILMKQFLILPYKEYGKCRNCALKMIAKSTVGT